MSAGLRRLPALVGWLASLQLTAAGLLLLALLVVWGTVYQASHGLHAAQTTFFHSWGFLAFGFLPLPGVTLVGLILLLNLLLAARFRLRWRWNQAGLIIAHLGLLLFLGGGYYMQHVSEETYLTLHEGESSSFSTSYRDWELAIWPESTAVKQVTAVDSDGMREGDEIALDPLPLGLRVDQFFPNCRAVRGAEKAPLTPRPPEADPQANLPGGTWSARAGSESVSFTLWAGAESAHSFVIGGRRFRVELRLKRLPLPVTLTLTDFRKRVYPGSEIPRAFESRVVVQGADIRREALISMNKPLRVREFTFYQSSYEEGGPGGDASTFSVVRNSGRLLPYFASGLLAAGLCVHFLGMIALRPRRRSQP